MLLGIGVITLLFILIIVQYVFPLANAQNVISWQRTTYPPNSDGIVEIADRDLSLNPMTITTFQTNVYSDSDLSGIRLEMVETAPNSGIFLGNVYFSTNFPSSGNRLHVSEGDTVTAEYVDRTLPPPYLDTQELIFRATAMIASSSSSYTLGNNSVCGYALNGNLMYGSNACPTTGTPTILSEAHAIPQDIITYLEKTDEEYYSLILNYHKCTQCSLDISKLCKYDKNGNEVPSFSDDQKKVLLDLQANYSFDTCPFTEKSSTTLATTTLAQNSLFLPNGYDKWSWPTFMHDSAHTSLSQYAGAQSNSTLWHYNAKNGTSALVLGPNDTIYFGSLGDLVALNGNNTEKFKITIGGIIDPPTIGTDGTLYLENGGTKLFAVQQDGTMKWKFQSNGTVTIPAIDIYDRIYFGSDNFLESLNPDGKLLFKFKTNGTVSMPSVGPDGIIYVGNTDHSFYAVEPSGTLKWKFDAKGITTPASTSPQGTIYFCDSDNYLYALGPDGTLKWTYQSTNNGAPPAIGPDGTLYLTDGSGVIAINPDGTKKWDFHPSDVTIQSVSVDRNGTIYLGSFENYLYAIDSNGSVRWNYKAYGSVGQPVIGSNGTIYFNSGEGIIYALGQPIPEFPLGSALIMTIVVIFGIVFTWFKKLRYSSK